MEIEFEGHGDAYPYFPNTTHFPPGLNLCDFGDGSTKIVVEGLWSITINNQPVVYNIRCVSPGKNISSKYFWGQTDCLLVFIRVNRSEFNNQWWTELLANPPWKGHTYSNIYGQIWNEVINTWIADAACVMPGHKETCNPNVKTYNDIAPDWIRFNWVRDWIVRYPGLTQHTPKWVLSFNFSVVTGPFAQPKCEYTLFPPPIKGTGQDPLFPPTHPIRGTGHHPFYPPTHPIESGGGDHPIGGGGHNPFFPPTHPVHGDTNPPPVIKGSTLDFLEKYAWYIAGGIAVLGAGIIYLKAR